MGGLALGDFYDAMDQIESKQDAAKAVLDALETVQGAKDDSAVTDPANLASNIALLKGMLTKIGDVAETPTETYSLLYRIAELENKLDTIINDGVTQKGSNLALSQTPKTGTKTVTSTAAEIFADTSRLSGRSVMYIRNTHDSIAIRIGASNITDLKGRRILPKKKKKIKFDPQSDIALYAISEYGDVKVEVFEA